jgi:hypothetical protein
MDWNETGEWLATAVLIAALLGLPRWFSFRNRAIAGAVLFPLGWAGMIGGVALGDRPFMQSEILVWAWMGASAVAIVLSVVLLVPVFFEWCRKRRKPRHVSETWTAGHWNG